MERVAARSTFVFLLFLVFFARSLDAQVQQLVPIGERVRVISIAQDSITGTLLSLRRDTLLIQATDPDRERLVPRAIISTFEVSRGTRSRAGFGARLGFLIGALGSAPILFVACAATDDCPLYAVPPVFAVGIGSLGAGIGALIGAASPRERWEGLSPDVLVGQ